LYYNFSIWYKLVDKTSIGAAISIAGAIITLLISIYYLPRVGYIASAWAAFACYLFMSITAVIIGRKYYPIPYPLKRILSYILFTAGIYFVSLHLRTIVDNTFIRIIVNTALLIIFILVVYYFERSIIHELFIRKKKT